MTVITIISVILIGDGAKYRAIISTSHKIHQITHIRNTYSTDSKDKPHQVTKNTNSTGTVKQKVG